METFSKGAGNLPAGISEYLNQQFREDYLTDIRLVKNSSGENFFYVDVTHENNIFHLKFNKKGELIQKEIEPIRYLDDEVDLGIVD